MTGKRGEIEVMILQNNKCSISYFQINKKINPQLIEYQEYSVAPHSIVHGMLCDMNALRSFSPPHQKITKMIPLIICVFSEQIHEHLSNTNQAQQDTEKKKTPQKKLIHKVENCCSKHRLFYRASLPYYFIMQYLLFSTFMHKTLLSITFPLQSLLALHHQTHHNSHSNIPLTEKSNAESILAILEKQKYLGSLFGTNGSLLEKHPQLLYALGSACVARIIL
jgi:hypothetical protein